MTLIRTTFIPLHTSLMTLRLYLYAVTGNGGNNWSLKVIID